MGAACAPSTDAEPTEDSTRRRGELSAGTCSASECGGQSETGCWCDEQCADYGDCCSNKQETCDAECIADPSLEIADIYFEIDGYDTAPWQNCYTVSTQEATRQIEAGEVPNGGENLELLRVEGETIYASHYQLSGAEIPFDKCVFDKQDGCALSCTATIYDAPLENPVTVVNESLEEKFQQKNPSYQAADCDEQVGYTVTLTDHTPLTRAEYKVAQASLAAGKGIYTVGAVGGVTMGNDLDANQAWSGGLKFYFMERHLYPELCDQSMADVAADPRGWIDTVGTWCPWSVDIAEIECEGLPRLANPEFEAELPLDMTSEDVQNYCSP